MGLLVMRSLCVTLHFAHRGGGVAGHQNGLERFAQHFARGRNHLRARASVLEVIIRDDAGRSRAVAQQLERFGRARPRSPRR